jgi:hypothetical protein
MNRHKKLTLSMETELVSLLKRKRVNISSYVERLLYQDLAIANGVSNQGGLSGPFAEAGSQTSNAALGDLGWGRSGERSWRTIT